MRFNELLYSARMGRVIRMELLATSGWLPGKLIRLRRFLKILIKSDSANSLEAPHE